MRQREQPSRFYLLPSNAQQGVHTFLGEEAEVDALGAYGEKKTGAALVVACERSQGGQGVA